MGAVTLHARGPLPVAVVWERYADPQRWPHWAPQIRRVDAVGRLRPGMTGRVHSYLPPGIAFRVLEVDARQRTWSWRGQLGARSLVVGHGGRGGAPRRGGAGGLPLRALPLLPPLPPPPPPPPR